MFSAKILGNDKLLIVIAIIHYVGGCILCWIVIEDDAENELAYDLIIVLDGLLLLIPFCILSIVSQRFHDSIGIRDEIRDIAIIFMLGLLGLALGAFISDDTIVRSQGI